MNNRFLEKIITISKVIQKNYRGLKVVPRISIVTEKRADVSNLNEDFEQKIYFFKRYIKGAIRAKFHDFKT